MNFLDPFYTQSQETMISISAEQGSAFAKQVAGDFNPIHHIDSKRFCVPGDLLFAIALSKYGLHKNMAFDFLGLVNADTPLTFPILAKDAAQARFQVVNEKDRAVLGGEFSGGATHRAEKIEQLIKSYVAFSGHNFPHILVPLMEQHQVMINPARPLVIYQSMSFELETLEFDQLELSLEATSLDVDGKRGNAKLSYSLKDKGELIGRGRKKLVLSGLREYEQVSIQKMCDQYEASKEA